MRISLSLKGDPRGRHLLLTVPAKEEKNGVFAVVVDQVLGGRTPSREVYWRPVSGNSRARTIDYTVYRFHVSFLEKLALTFPQAEWSGPAERYRKRHLYEEVMAGPTPNITVPGFKGELYPFQKKGVRWIEDQLAEFSAGMLNDALGAGKTVQVYSHISRRRKLKSQQTRGCGIYRRVLVITTQSGKWSWKKIAHEPTYLPGKRKPNPPMFPLLDVSVIDGDRAKRHRLLREKRLIKVVNLDMLRIDRNGKMSYPELFSREWDLIVVDEYHKARNPYAQVSKGFHALDAKEFIIMSGTPFMNRPEELWSAFHRVDPEMWPDYNAFTLTLPIFGEDGKPVGYNRRQVKKIKTFLDTHSLRRTKRDFGVELPKENSPVLVPVELTPEQTKLYVKLRDEFLMELEDGTVKTVAHALAHITRLKQACFSPELYGGSRHSAKIDKLKDLVEELVASGNKAIIFSQWSSACRIIQRELEEYEPAFVTGDVPSHKRPAQEDLFNRNPNCKLYIGTIGANQEAITLSAATHTIFTDQDWVPGNMEQAAGRGAGGGLRGAWVKDQGVWRMELRAVNTIEDYIDELLSTKSRLFNSFIESKGGTMIKRVTVNAIQDLLRREARKGKAA